MKKFLALLLALIMVLGMVACGATTETTETETKEETKTETKEETKKEETKEEATEETEEEEYPMLEASAIVFTSTGFVPKAESWGVDYYRENYGLDLEICQVDSSTSESWNIFWAGGGYADIILPYNGSQSVQLVNDGLVRTIEFDMLKENMPRMYTLLTDVYGSDDEILAALEMNGDVYCIPYSGFATSNVAFNTAFRTDWLENLGLEAYNGMTVDELEEIVRAFAEDDPDGNGLDDTYAFTGGRAYGIFSLAAAYGVAGSGISYLTSEDGNSMYANVVTDEYRAYVAKLAEWYQNGWIDPEFLTDDRGTCRNKLANGNIGIYSDNPWWWEAARGEVGPLAMVCTGQNLDPATALTFVTDWADVETGEPMHNADPADITGQAAVFFGYETSDEVVIRTMQMVDEAVQLFTFDEEDLAAQYEYAVRSKGKEGENWEVDENGRCVVTNPMNAEDGQVYGNYLFPTAAAADYDAFIGTADEFVIELYQQAHGANRYWNGRDRKLPSLSGISTELGDKSSNVSDYYSTCYGQFISGELDINDDAVWAEYIATLEEYGLNDIIAAYEEYFGM